MCKIVVIDLVEIQLCETCGQEYKVEHSEETVWQKCVNCGSCEELEAKVTQVYSIDTGFCDKCSQVQEHLLCEEQITE